MHSRRVARVLRRLWRGGGFALLVFVAIVMTWHALWRRGNARAVAALLDQAKGRGEPTTLEELKATYPGIPQDQNAYVLLERLWLEEDPGFWTAFRSGRRPLPERRKSNIPPGTPFLDKTVKVSATNALEARSREALAGHVALQASHLSRLKEALKRSDLRAPIVLEAGFGALLPYLPAIKEEAMLLRLEMLAAMEDGDADRALEVLEDLERLKGLLDRDPLLIGQLVRLSVSTMAIRSMERLMNRCRLSEAQLGRVEVMLLRTNDSAALRRAFQGERLIILNAFEASGRGAPDLDGTSPTEKAAGMRLWRWCGMATAERRLVAETFADLFRQLDRPEPWVGSEWHAVFARMQTQASGFPPHIFCRMLLPALEKAGGLFGRHEALRRCALVAVGIERERLQQGLGREAAALGVPASLERSITLDPFTGATLRLVQRPEGYLVYSVGPDQSDDGGQLESRRPGASAEESFDVGFQVSRGAP